MLFEIVMIIYWLGLSAWFGGVLFVLLAPPVVLKTVKDANPILPTVLAVNLEGQHGTLLAGSIVSALVKAAVRIELFCAALVFVSLCIQWFFIELRGLGLVFPVLRNALFLAAIACVFWNWRVIWPRVMKYRQEYLENADNPEVANPALDQYDRYQNDSLAMLRNVLLLLLGLVVFSATIRPAAIVIG
jgi:hypothetical protein